MAPNSGYTGSLAPAPNVLFQEIEGETVLLDHERGSYFALDEVGTRVWQLLVEHGDVAAVKREMLAEFEVDASTLDADLHDFLGALRAAGLVVAREHQ